MEERMHLHKALHPLIEQFINKFEEYIQEKKLDKDKIFIEVLKRSSSISQAITAVASTFLTSYKTADAPISEEAVQKKIALLVEATLQQDLVECALIAEEDSRNIYLSNDDLHNFLYICCVNGSSPVSPSPMHLLSSFSFEGDSFSSCFSRSQNDSFTQGLNHTCLPLSQQFENTQAVFENELLQLKHTLGMGIPNVNLKLSDESSVLEDKCANIRSSRTFDENVVSASIGDWLESTETPGDKFNNLLDNSLPYPRFLSWESSVKQSVACHLYTTELCGKEVAMNIIDEDPHMFRALHNSSGVVPQNDFIRDILDLLVGIPSTTFLYDKVQKKFQMKSLTRLLNQSHESTSKFSEKFMEAATMFHRLKSFSTDCIQPSEGLVLKGLKNGIKEILSVYMEYIASVKMNNPTMYMLRTDISENAELVNTLGVICGISCSGSEDISLPKGLGLLNFLNKASWSYKSKGNAIMVAVVLKFAYSPYFEFLNKWMTEGVCCDPYNEFQIAEDIMYLNRKDELYWKFAFTNIEGDNLRSIPQELEKYSHGILQCGKSMRLLQNCCPELYSLEYMCCNPPPALSMVFSYHAVNVMREVCASYIRQKETSELEQKKLDFVVSEDYFLLDKQITVEKRAIQTQLQRKWNKIMELSLAEGATKEDKEETLKRCKSFPNISRQHNDNGFNGIIHYSIGLLFSSCGYNSNTFDSNACTLNLENKKASMLHSGKFSRQLNLKSYFHSIPFSAEEFHNESLKKFHPKSTIDTKSQVGSRPEELPIEDNCIRIISDLGSFTDSLASLLLSEYGDTKDDICSCLQMTSLQNLMQYNFSAVMNMRMHLIQKTIVDYIINELGLKDLLLCLRNTYFLQDESFSQSLCKRLFNWAVKCDSLDEFADWSTLNEMLTRSVAVPSLSSVSFLANAVKCDSLDEFADWSTLNEMLTRSVAVPSLSSVSFLANASVNFVTMPEEYISRRNKFMHFFCFEFKIDWPLNIIIHKACITHYSRIFSFILEIEFLCWMLGKIWRSLLISANEKKLENSPQYRKLMLDRFDMHQFIRVLRNCIHQDLGGPLWEYLEKILRTEEISIDALEDIHVQYLERALVRCFLTDETAHLHDVLEFLFQQVEKFCRAVLDCSWELNPDTHHYESSEFESLSDCYSKFQKLKETFYERISKMVRRKTFQRMYDEHYQLYLETILETGRNM